MQFLKQDLSAEKLIELYKQLVLPRLIEEKMLVLLRQEDKRGNFQSKAHSAFRTHLIFLPQIFTQCVFQSINEKQF